MIASQALNFEATIRESRPEAEIVAPTKGSEQATIAASAAGNTIADKANFRIAGDHYEGPRQAGYMPIAIVSPCRATYQRLRGSVTTATSTSLRILAAEYITLVNRHQQQGVTLQSATNKSNMSRFGVSLSPLVVAPYLC
jgi:hypothetical protein